ncbi:hypothetical protein FACS1894211_07630 [Clostridia bacterium]|nr:hypothetical protein FACS1894211_07630 [Clostridia bacterium]
MDIKRIDKNFIGNKLNIGGVSFFDAKEKPFGLYGVFYDKPLGRYLRMPAAAAARVSEGVNALNAYTSGGRLRFITDSEYIAIRCVTDSACLMPHMPLTGSCGFSLYADGTYYQTFIPDSAAYIEKNNGYESVVHFPDKRRRDITIYFPLYNAVRELFVGFAPDAALDSGKKYGRKIPIVFYGSSITQGGCASRPGNSYDAIVARMLDSDYINLGFSGNCKAESVMADYLTTLDASVFVYDYDANAPDKDYLEKTHYALYARYRAVKTNTPIVMLSRPDFDGDKSLNAARREVIRASYEKAVASGDENVYFIDGETLFGKTNRDCCTADGCHPNDAGFLRMAETVYPVIKRIIESFKRPIR